MSNQKFEQERSQSLGGNTGAAMSRKSGSGSASLQQSGSSSTITSQVQGVLDEQVVKGARMVTNVAKSARRAAEELETNTPQLAGLVRGMADRMEDYSRNLEDQSVTDIYQAASDFTRRQPAVIFGVAALAGFVALRTLRSSPTGRAPGRKKRGSSAGSEEFHGS